MMEYLPIAFKLAGRRTELEMVGRRLLPIIKLAMEELPELLPIIKSVWGDIEPIVTGKEKFEPSVTWLQQSLVKLGVAPNLTIDGDYGEATQEAVKLFQQAHGLTVDGWAGIYTIAKIQIELAK